MDKSVLGAWQWQPWPGKESLQSLGLKTLKVLNLCSSSCEREWGCKKELSVRDATELEWAKCGDINRESAVDSKSEFLSICY